MENDAVRFENKVGIWRIGRFNEFRSRHTLLKTLEKLIILKFKPFKTLKINTSSYFGIARICKIPLGTENSSGALRNGHQAPAADNLVQDKAVLSPLCSSFNVLSSSGTCDVTPRNGRAMHTPFMIRCTDWQDDDQPLTYEFAYLNVQESVFFLSRISYAESIFLPMGHEDNDFKLSLRIRIIDKLGAATTKAFTIQVRESHGNVNCAENR